MRIEVCAPNYEIARAAVQAGANRIEICQALDLGGLTPSYSFIEKACSLNVPVRVLIRPRPGDFLYAVDEMEMMLKDIEICGQLGAEGVVIGALNENSEVDLGANRIFRESHEDLKFIFHRGIDLAGEKGMNMIQKIGFHGALCSGHINGLSEGLEIIGTYKDNQPSDFEIVAGGGLNENNLTKLLKLNIESIHFSCQKKVNTGEDIYGFKNVFNQEKWEEIEGVLKQ